MARWVLVLIACLAAGCYLPAPDSGPVAAAPTSEVMLSGGEGTEVLAEGVAAPTVQGGADIARDRALHDALRRAVEQGVGTYVNSETRVENFQLLSDRIYSQARGYVSSYRVVTEGQEAGLYRVVVRAKVKLDDIENDLAAIGILVLEQGRPRTMVVIKELTGAAEAVDVEGLLEPMMLETMILDRFRAKGFPVVDAATVQRNLEKEQLRKIVAGDAEAAVLLGLKAGAEVIVAGAVRSSAERRPIAGQERDVYAYQASVRAIGIQDAEILGASAAAVVVPFSRDAAREQAADTIATELVGEILGRWRKRENVTVLAIANASHDRVLKLKAELAARLRGVTRVISRDLTGADATLEVVSEMSSQEILEQLGTRGFETRFEVVGFEGNRIELRLE